MEFQTHILSTPLKEHIESVFHFKGFVPDHSIERVVPTGHVFIVFELDGIPRNTFNNTTLKPNGVFSNVWISGMHKNFLSISAHQDSEMLVIQFKPEGSFPFIHDSIDKLNNKVVLAQHVFGKEILQLRQQILHQKSSKEKFKIIEHWLLNRFDSSKVASQELFKMVNVFQNKSFNEHGKIVQSYSKTQKHLISQFKKHLGLTPKVLHRIFRFNEILKRIHLKEKIDWLQIVHQFGYTDQSHFIKEFKEFSGFSPQEFIISEHHKEEPNFFPLDKKG